MVTAQHCPPTKEISMPRQLIEPHKGDKRYVRRKKGKFTSKQASVGRSLAADRRSKAKRAVKKGEGDRGDQRRWPCHALPGDPPSKGIVSKRRGSPYRSGRSSDWIKSKNPAAPAVKREAEDDRS
jgi:hypothetical protein